MSLLSFVILLIVAGLAGMLGQMIGGFSYGGCIVSVLVGFVGAFVGTWIARQFGLLAAMGTRVVFGTVPNVTDIAFAADGQDMINYLGSDYGLPADSRTTMAAIMFVTRFRWVIMAPFDLPVVPEV